MNNTSSNGYSLSKNGIPEELINGIKKELTLMPIANKDYSFNVKPIKYYRETKTSLIVPKYYGIEKFGEAPFKGNALLKKELKMSKTYALRDNQKEITERALDCLGKKGGSIICMGTGMGKTSCALYIMSCFSKKDSIKPLIIVNKVPLLDQWKERIEQFMPLCSVGIIQGQSNERDKDITIAMLHTIALRKEGDFSEFNFIVADETHHLSSTEFSNVMFRCSGKYTLGLSATPERKDGLTKAIVWSFGEIISVKNEKKRKCRIETHEVNFKIEKKYLYTGKLNMAGAITTLCEHRERTNYITDIIKKLYLEPKRNILVLCDRIAFLKDAHALLKNHNRGMYIGKMKKHELEESSTKRIIFASFSIFSEGIDIPALNTIVLCSPKSDIVQVSGRIFRKEHEISPVIVDIIDKCEQIFVSQSRKRKAFYIKSGFTFSNCDVTEEDEIEQLSAVIKGCGIESGSEEE